MPNLVQPFELLVLTIIATLSVAVRSAGAVPHQGDLSSGGGTRRLVSVFRAADGSGPA